MALWLFNGEDPADKACPKGGQRHAGYRGVATFKRVCKEKAASS